MAVFCSLHMYPVSWRTLFLSTTLQINREIRYVFYSNKGLQVPMAGLAQIFWVIALRIIVVSFRRFEECAASNHTVAELPSGGYLKLI